MYSHIGKMSIITNLSPVAVPTSFEGPFGKVSYRVKAVIDTPRFSKDYKAQKPFYLLNLLNLNEVPDIEVRNGRSLRANSHGSDLRSPFVNPSILFLWLSAAS